MKTNFIIKYLLFYSASFCLIVKSERLWEEEYSELNSRNIPEDATEFWSNVTNQILQMSRSWSATKYREWEINRKNIVPGTISQPCLNVIDHILTNFIGDDQWTAKGMFLF